MKILGNTSTASHLRVVSSFSIKELPIKIYNLLLRRNKLLLLFACCPVFLGCAYEISISPLLVALICLFGGMIISHLLAKDKMERKELSHLFYAIFSLSLIVSAIIFVLTLRRYGIPYVFGPSDEMMFVDKAMEASKAFSMLEYGQLKQFLGSFNSPGWVWLISAVMRFDSIFGNPGVVSIRIVNSLFIGIIALLTFKVGQESKLNLNVCRVGGLISGLFPSMLVLGASVMRDILVAMITMLCFYVIICSGKKIWSCSNLIKMVIVLLCVSAMFELRFLNGVALVILAIFTIISLNIIKGKINSIVLLAVLFLLLLFAGFKYLPFLQERSTAVMLDSFASHEGYAMHRLNKTTEDSLSQIVFNTPLLPFGAPLRLAYSQIVPVPIPSSDMILNFEILGTIFRVLTFPFLLFGIFLFLNSKDLSKKLLVFWYGVLLCGVAFTSFTARQMLQVLPFAILSMTEGFYSFPRNRNLVLLLMLTIFLFLGMLYVIVKAF